MSNTCMYSRGKGENGELEGGEKVEGRQCEGGGKVMMLHHGMDWSTCMHATQIVIDNCA